MNSTPPSKGTDWEGGLKDKTKWFMPTRTIILLKKKPSTLIRVEGWKKMFQGNGPWTQAGVAAYRL
jgi:hypothetical protein